MDIRIYNGTESTLNIYQADKIINIHKNILMIAPNTIPHLIIPPATSPLKARKRINYENYKNMEHFTDSAYPNYNCLDAVMVPEALYGTEYVGYDNLPDGPYDHFVVSYDYFNAVEVLTTVMSPLLPLIRGLEIYTGELKTPTNQTSEAIRKDPALWKYAEPKDWPRDTLPNTLGLVFSYYQTLKGAFPPYDKPNLPTLEIFGAVNYWERPGTDHYWKMRIKQAT